MNTDVLIVGSGCSGLYCALKLPRDIRITLITKSDLESNDSFLAQGGMCMLKEQSDFDSFFEDTLKAGHYENDKESVEIMINTSPEVVEDLVSYGADFARNDDGSLAYTREGAHSHNRIIFHEDVTGKEITSTLLAQVKKLSNVTLMEYTTMVDIIERDNKCYGAIIRKQDGTLEKVTSGIHCHGLWRSWRTVQIFNKFQTSDKVTRILGVLNGTSNFMMTKMVDEGWSYEDALKTAQELGYAESDPTNDVEGYDAAYKAVILSQFGFGATIDFDDVSHKGITTSLQTMWLLLKNWVMLSNWLVMCVK